MDLFGYDPLQNILPAEGIVNYHGPVLGLKEAKAVFDELLVSVPWKNDEAMIYGKHIITARKVAWYGDSDYDYAYSGTTKTALAWSPVLRGLKRLVEGRAGTEFNSCLLNLYYDGGEGMGWHSDDEKSLGVDTVIASLSLGAERNFRFRHKRSGETVSVFLEDGGLLVMKGATQSHWQHCLPKSMRVTTPRINLTFRTIKTELQKGR